jgi:DNA polymerase III alpha subunit
MITNNSSKSLIEETIKKFIDILDKENIYLEIQPQNPENNKLLFKINKKILELSNYLKLNLVVNNNFHYISKEDKTAF